MPTAVVDSAVYSMGCEIGDDTEVRVRGLHATVVVFSAEGVKVSPSGTTAASTPRE
jgi:hypothetical protein